MSTFDFRESTASFDYERRLVEFYFTRKCNYEACIKRNPNYIVAEDLKPGYRILYSFNQCRTPEYLLRVRVGSPAVAKPQPELAHPHNTHNVGVSDPTTAVEEVG